MKPPIPIIARALSNAPDDYKEGQMWDDLQLLVDYCGDLHEALRKQKKRNEKLKQNLERFAPGNKMTVDNYVETDSRKPSNRNSGRVPGSTGSDPTRSIAKTENE